jgi:hypothetical protein|tara:strand:+ start:10084 stop:10995 length:912 start_codon:yes stop_codon:yes gene_type:complete
MSNSFSDLKRSRNNSLKTLIEETGKMAGGAPTGDTNDRFWKPNVDKAGNGYAVLRFLPAAKGDDLPWVRTFNHGFQGTGGWYIEESLTTIGKQDPVSEHNSTLWNSGIESNKDLARKQKRRLQYISNIMIVSDPSNPDNNGKIFLFKYGKKIWDKLNDLMNPQFADESPVNPFDFWEGANFKLKIRQVEGYRNYDKSEFEAPEALAEDDALEAIWEKQHALSEFTDPNNFKSYDELQAKLNRVLGLDGGINEARSRSVEDIAPAPTPSREAAAPQVEQESAPWAATTDDDDSMSFFEKLAADA